MADSRLGDPNRAIKDGIVSREELAALAELGAREGVVDRDESRILKNLLSLPEPRVADAMTPRTVVFSIPEDMTVGAFFAQHETEPFSRIPVHAGGTDEVTGFVLRGDLLLAQAKGETRSHSVVS